MSVAELLYILIVILSIINIVGLMLIRAAVFYLGKLREGNVRLKVKFSKGNTLYVWVKETRFKIITHNPLSMNTAFLMAEHNDGREVSIKCSEIENMQVERGTLYEIFKTYYFQK